MNRKSFETIIKEWAETLWTRPTKTQQEALVNKLIQEQIWNIWRNERRVL
jgi:hypothetical protein